MKFKRIFSIYILLSLSAVLFARPKVALVLSGGGAKGIAEIPLLEAMEKEGIRPDMVLGTSMGALIGSLYASGYTPREIRETILSLNYFDILSERPMTMERVPPEAFSQRSNSDLSLSFSIMEKRIGSAPGIIGDQKILCELNNHMSRVLGIDDFDRLPIPFRCVATDVSSGEAIVLKSGSVVEAVRASISLPAVFTPAPLGDGRYTMDGGLRNNLPVKLAREMGADIIIAMDVASVTDMDPKALNDMGSVTEQLISLIISTNAVEQYKECTIILTPDLRKISTIDFFHPKEILAIGEKCVEENMDKIRSLATSLAKSGCPLQSLDYERQGIYDGLDDYVIKKISIRDVSFDPSGPLPKEKQFAKYLDRTLDDRTKAELTDLLCELKKHYHFSSLTYGVRELGKGKDCELIIKANHYKQQSNKIFLSGSPSVTFTNNEAQKSMAVDPSSTTGIFFVEPVESLLRYSTGDRMIVDATVYPKFASWNGYEVNCEIGGRFKYGSLEPKTCRYFTDRQVDKDRGTDFNLGFRFKYTDMINFRLGAATSADYINSSGTWFSTNWLYSEFILTTLHNSFLKMSGVQTQFAAYLGDFSTEAYEIDMIYAVHMATEHRFEIVKDRTSLGFELELCNNRFPWELSSGYGDMGGINGMCGYAIGTFKRDFGIAGLTLKQRLFNFAGMPLYFIAQGKVSVSDGYDPYYSDCGPSGDLLDGFEKPEAGFGTYFALDTPIGAVVLGYSLNTSNKWTITLALK